MLQVETQYQPVFQGASAEILASSGFEGIYNNLMTTEIKKILSTLSSHAPLLYGMQ
jgi:hypothetical protein